MALAKTAQSVSATLDAADEATDSIDCRLEERYAVSVSGTFVGTVALQRSFDGGSNWRTIESYTAATEQDGIAAANQLLRLKMTAYTSGSAIAEIHRTRQ